jgi:hypothetical protein
MVAPHMQSEPEERMLRMDQVRVIRPKVLVEGQSVRSVARQMGCEPQHGPQVPPGCRRQSG